MKKIIILISALLLLTFVSCSDKPEEQPKNKYGLTSEEEALTNLVAEESVACYYSLLTEDGFGNYILAFPAEWREGYQAELDMVEYMFENIRKKISASSANDLKIQALPSKLFAPGDRFMDLVTINPNGNTNLITSFGSWKPWTTTVEGDKYRVGYSCTGLNGNEPIKFTFTGTELYIPMESTETVNLKITLDDGAGHKYTYFYGADTGNPYRINNEGPLPKATYNVTITIDNPTEGKEVVIYDIIYR